MKTHAYLEEILKICTHNHLTIDEIFERLQKKFPKAGKSSIYRNVRELADAGELKKVLTRKGKSYFERNIGEHGHAVCQKSGEILDFDLADFKLPKLPKNFVVKKCELRVFGEIKK